MRIFIFLASILLCLTCSSTSFAEVDIGGFVKADSYILLREKSPAEVGKLGSELRLKASSQVGSDASLLGLLDVETDGLSLSKEVLSLREAYVDLYLEWVDVRLGKQIISWGKADGVNPTDNINPTDLTRIYLDPLNPEGSKVGVWLARAEAFFTNFLSLEGIWIPVFTPSVVTIAEQEERISLGGGITYTVSLENKPILPVPELANTQGAVRFSGSFAPIDASVSYFYGWDHLPDLQLELGATKAVVRPKYNRLYVVGVDFATELGDVDLRGEGAYFFTADPSGEKAEVKNPNLFYVLGLGYTFLDNNLITNLQFAQRVVTNHKKPADYMDPIDQRIADEFDKVSGQRDALQNALLGRIAYTLLDQTLEFSLLGAYVFERSDLYLAPRVSYDYADGVRITLGGNIYEGGDQFSTFGMFDNYDNIFLEVRYSF